MLQARRNVKWRAVNRTRCYATSAPSTPTARVGRDTDIYRYWRHPRVERALASG